MARSLATPPRLHDAIVRRGHIGRGWPPPRVTVRDVPRRRGTGNLVGMEGSGPFNFGDFQDDPDDAAHDEDGLQPAWLPPEDRLWRHPSEVARHGQPQGESTGPATPVRASRQHRFTVTAGVVGAAAVATAAVVAFTLVNSHQVQTRAHTVSTVQETSFVTVPVSDITAPLVTRMMSALRPSLIAIRL